MNESIEDLCSHGWSGGWGGPVTYRCVLCPETEGDRKFLEFHRDNPNVYKVLAAFARRAKQLGRHRRLGVRMLWERMRWELLIETRDPHSDYKLNDHYHSRYARLLMQQEQDLWNIFELRELRS